MGHVERSSNGPISANVIFAFLSIVLTFALQREHALNCYVLPLQKNAARLFILAPAYTIFIFLTAYTPHTLKPVWDIFNAVWDGYALYCFFGLVVLGAGGEDYVIAQLEASLAVVAGRNRRGEGQGEVNGGATGSGRNEDGRVLFPCCLCIPLKFRNAERLYGFLKRSVMQVMFTRPLFLAVSAVAGLGSTRLADLAMRICRLMALFVLVYAVMTVGRLYHLVHKQIWKAFNPVMAFMTVKGFILLITIQDFIMAMIFDARDPDYVLPATKAALRAYSLVVSVQGLVYLFVARQFFLPKIFQLYNPRTAIRMTMSVWTFLVEVYYFHNVLEGDLPPLRKPDNGEAGEGEVETKDVLEEGGIDIRVLSTSSAGPAGISARGTSPARR